MKKCEMHKHINGQPCYLMKLSPLILLRLQISLMCKAVLQTRLSVHLHQMRRRRGLGAELFERVRQAPCTPRLLVQDPQAGKREVIV